MLSWVKQVINQYWGFPLPYDVSLKSVLYTQGFYVALYFYLPYNKAKIFIDEWKEGGFPHFKPADW